MSTITIARLHEVFEINESILTRKSGRFSGPVRGSLRPDGYLNIWVDGKNMLMHRVVFALHNNRWPVGMVDHKNRIRSDNSPENLREATASENSFNADISRHNSSGITGVCWSKWHNKWQVQIRINRKQTSLGFYDDIELASLVRSEAVRKHHREFARVI